VLIAQSDGESWARFHVIVRTNSVKDETIRPKMKSKLTISVVAQLDLVGLSSGGGSRETRWQPDVLQDQTGRPLHGVVAGGREVEPDAAVGDGDNVETLRLGWRYGGDADDGREVGFVDVAEVDVDNKKGVRQLFIDCVQVTK
jgi:hypothetical protein